MSVADGSKGPRLYDWAAVKFGVPTERGLLRRLLIRRHIQTGEHAYYFCAASPAVTDNPCGLRGCARDRELIEGRHVYFAAGSAISRVRDRYIADHLVRLCAAYPYLMEIYDSRSGEGMSLPEYSFVATALIDIILRRYRDPSPWTRQS